MLQQIIGHTPPYVWVILAFLVQRGLACTRTRTVTLRALFVLPVVMAVLALLELDRRFGLSGLVGAAWVAAAALGALLTWQTSAGLVSSTDRAAGTVTQRGSWVPLTLILVVFCTRYALAVACTMQPALCESEAFALTVSTALGLCNGLFIGRSLHCLQAWQDTAPA